MPDPINRPLPEDSIPADTTPPTKANRKARAEVADIERHGELKDLAAVLSTDAGRRVLLRVLERGRLYSKDDSPDALAMARIEGRRQVAAWLVAEIMAVHEDAYPNLLSFHVRAAKRRAEFLASVKTRHA